MSYTLEFWALALDKLAGRTPAAPPGPADGALAEAVVAAIGELGRPIGSVDHSSSGGDWFRDEIIAGPVAEVLGDELAGHLLSRPLNGITWPEYPGVGWATNPELRAAVARADEREDDVAGRLDSDDAELLETIVGAVRSAADSGSDLVTTYS
jgi:hypothetical protein